MTSISFGYQIIGKRMMFGLSLGGGYNRYKAYVQPERSSNVYNFKNSLITLEAGLKVGFIVLKEKISKKN